MSETFKLADKFTPLFEAVGKSKLLLVAAQIRVHPIDRAEQEELAMASPNAVISIKEPGDPVEDFVGTMVIFNRPVLTDLRVAPGVAWLENADGMVLCRVRTARHDEMVRHYVKLGESAVADRKEEKK